MKFLYTTAIDKIRRMAARKKVVQGGKDAGKTFGIIPILIDKAARIPEREISIVSDSLPNLRRGALKDFKKIMKSTGRWNPHRWNKTHLTYTFANGSYIEFFSADDENKVRGPRRTDLYINEANRLNFETYHQMASRTSGDIYIDFNPTAEFWAHTEVLKEPDAEHLILTYRDNEAVEQHVLDDFKIAAQKAADGLKYWINWCRVYIDGLIGSLEGAVLEDWEIVDDIPKDAELLGYGMDFGWQVPSAVVAVYFMDGRYYLDETIYEPKLSNQDIAQMLLDYGVTSEEIYADSAEPKSIEEISKEGLNIHPCGNKQDIKNYAIQKLNRQTFYITARSEGLINEARNLVWGKDSKGKPTGKPKKGNDHACDATFYFIGTVDRFDGTY